MNWKIVLTLSLFGVLMGVLSTLGFTHGYIEIVLWLVIAIISALVIERSSQNLLVTQGFIVGFLASLLKGIYTAIFSTTYFLNNPGVQEQFDQITADLPDEFYLIIVSVLVGLVYGLFVGFVVYLTRKTKTKSK